MEIRVLSAREVDMKIRFEHGGISNDFMVGFGFNWDEEDVGRLYFTLGLWYFNICFDKR